MKSALVKKPFNLLDAGRYSNPTVRLVVALLLDVVCFLVDIHVPRGLAAGLLYLFPLFLLWHTDTRIILVGLAGSSALSVAGLFFSSPGLVPIQIVIENRIAGLVVFTTFSLLSISQVNFIRRLEKQDEQLQRQAIILDQVHDAVVTIDSDNRIQYMNKAAYQQYDIDVDEPVLGSKLGTYFSFEWQSAQQQEEYTRAIQTAGYWKGEKIHITHQKRRIWGESVISLTKDRYDNPGGVVAVVRDASSRKQSEMALVESKEQLRLANEAAGIGIWSVEPQAGSLFWDSTTRKHWGVLPMEELSIQLLWERTHPEDVALFQRAFAAARDKGIVSTLEFRVRHPDNSIHYLRSTGRAIKDTNGNVQRIIGTSLDITEQKLKEQSLRDYAQGLDFLSNTAVRMLHSLALADLFKLIAERIYSLADGAIVVVSEFNPLNHKTIVREVSCTTDERNTLQRLLHRELKEFSLDFSEQTRDKMTGGKLSLVEDGVCDLAFYQLPKRLCNAIEQALHIGNIFAMPIALDTDMLGIVAIVSHNKGTLRNTGLIESTVNMAALALQRKRFNDELRKRASELEYANRELESFSYSVTHDLRGPLQAIMGFAQLLQEDYSRMLDREGRDVLERIVANSKRMDSLIDDIMKLSKVSRQEMKAETVDLSAMTRLVISDFEKTDPKRLVRTIIQDGCVVCADTRLLYIVMTNLIGNAWKYTSKTADARIEFGGVSVSGEDVFFVRDNGAGFDMKYAENLFVPFKRLHVEKEFSGTGVGLATVARIINRHGGRIWAQSEVGKGATFFFTLRNKGTSQRTAFNSSRQEYNAQHDKAASL